MQARCRTVGVVLGALLLVVPALHAVAGTHTTAMPPSDHAAPGHSMPMQMPGGNGHGGREGAAPHAQETPDDDPVVEAFREANERMHAAMRVPWTGNADRDFATAMIPHHQGAIEMAEILLEHGRNPALRALAEEIIEAQQREIEFLQRWLAENPE